MEGLVKHRANYKAAITRIETFVKKNKLDKTVSISEFSVREEALRSTFKKYEDIQDQIEGMDNSETLINDRITIETKYYSIRAELNEVITRPSTSNYYPASVSSNVQGMVKVPELSIPTFSGKFSEWSTFYDLFKALIIDNDQLSNVQKFIYLKSSLKFEPLHLVENLQLTNDNFIIALSTLKDRYDNKLFVVNAHIRSLIEIPSINHKSPGSSLREFITAIRQHLESLKNLSVPVQTWDLILIYLLSQKLDFPSKQAFELNRGTNELPCLQEFLQFLEKRCSALENLSAPEPKGKSTHFMVHDNDRGGSSSGISCSYCKGLNHKITKCFKFKALQVSQRKQFVIANKLCFKCLSEHLASACSWSGCPICNGGHNALLHINSRSQPGGQTRDKQSQGDNSHSNRVIQGNSKITQQSQGSEVETDTHANNRLSNNEPIQSLSACALNKTHYVLLATARVCLFDSNGYSVIATALLDNGSQSCFITKELVKRLNYQTYNKGIQITGIAGKNSICTEMVDVSVFPNIHNGRNNREINMSCLVLDNITCKLPHGIIDINKLRIPNDLKLADPTFYESKSIDLLIGADVYYDLLVPGMIRLGNGLPMLQNSSLGWVIAGNVPDHFMAHLATVNNNNISLLSSTSEIHCLMERFWQSEEVATNKVANAENDLAENIFRDTTVVLKNGSFQVSLLLKTPTENSKLGDSYTMAKKRFFNLEKRFTKDNNLFLEYKRFIEEYVSLGHAKYVPLTFKNDAGHNKYFLPHHCVIKQERSTTKLRVVFDASMKSSMGYSLNDVTLKGFTVQPKLVDILCRFRLFKFVLIADIEKMYRQIKVDPSQTFLQNILWRNGPSDSLKCLELQTVTYSTKAAPFLATRCLTELASKNMTTYPLAANTVLSQCYVDDILGGAETYEDLLELKNQLCSLLGLARFKLHKWNTNCRKFASQCGINEPLHEYNIKSEDKSNKVLGMSWSPRSDVFSVTLPQQINKSITKRNVLSIIAQLYDPLGLITPVIVVAKILMQKIWLAKLEWDDELPSELKVEWHKFRASILGLSDLKISRWLFDNKERQTIEIHGFADASLKAFGACVYLRVLYLGNIVSCNLICSKSRVAPLKTMTIPRLELSACALLAKLVTRVLDTYKNNFVANRVNLWTDSQIVLCWLKSHPSRWNMFVSNRVAEIQELTSNFQWCHVQSADNPADLLSRGLDSKDLIDNKLWWMGPTFLQNFHLELDKFNFNENVTEIPEKRKIALTINNDNHDRSQIFNKYSSFRKLQRILSYCLRFVKNLTLPEPIKITGPLTVTELDNTLKVIIKYLQNKHFPTEIAQLTELKIIKNKVILSLNPFLDQNGILRVGGRLANADVPYDQKYLILLPSKSYVVTLMLKLEHLKLYHGGPHTVLSNFRLRYWPLNGLREIKRIIKNCVTCHRFNCQSAQQIMADLPRDRVIPTRAFQKVGIDFGGPFLIKGSKTRRASLIKSYIAMFVCMVTKCVHIELVTGLSTEAFLLTFKRFISRRGNPTIIYSDNATNFLGARNQLRELHDFFKGKENKDAIVEFLSISNIQWKFIPPRSPHWGGLWEAAIKSAKYHILRVIGETRLTFEEFTTVLAQIEAILNSRPICSLSNDPTDLSVLTSGHFLIGESLVAYPEKEVIDIPDNRLSIWQRCSKMQQQFWKRWSVEYLNQLQNCPKWLRPCDNLNVNQIVLIRDDNSPPLRWAMGRITELLPGADGKVRLVKLRTKEGVLTRPIRKVSPLSIEC